MTKRLLTLLALTAGLSTASFAQEHIYLIKGTNVVAKYPVSDVDYMTFQLPDGVKEAKDVEVEVANAGKNFITYKVVTLQSSEQYAHTAVSASVLNYVLQEYFSTTLENATQADIESALRSILYSYGYLAKGSQVFTMKDGDVDDNDEAFTILAGETYYVVACNVVNDDLGETISYTTVNTLEAEQSKETVAVAYTGLASDGGASFSITPSEGITAFYTLFGYKDTLEPYIQQYGIKYTALSFGERWTPAEWTSSPATWSIKGEADYSLYVLGIDGEGDRTEASVTAHIVPSASESTAPTIKVNSKTKGNGAVSVKFEVTPSNVTEVYVNLLEENTVESKLNRGFTLADLAAGSTAIDVTNDINTNGEYTYSNESVDSGWQTLLVSAKSKEGDVTVLRLNFNANVDSDWDETTTVFPASSTSSVKASFSKFSSPLRQLKAFNAVRLGGTLPAAKDLKR